jgi:hypothetical protein
MAYGLNDNVVKQGVIGLTFAGGWSAQKNEKDENPHSQILVLVFLLVLIIVMMVFTIERKHRQINFAFVEIKIFHYVN